MNPVFAVTFLALLTQSVELVPMVQPLMVNKSDSVVNISIDPVTIGDTYVVFNITGPKFISDLTADDFNVVCEMAERKTYVSLEKLNQTLDLSLIKKSENAASGMVTLFLTAKSLSPVTQYRFRFVGKYYDSVTLKRAGYIVVQTKALKPTSGLNKVVTLNLNRTDINTYYVQVDKLVRKGRYQTISNFTIAPAFGSKVTLDGIIAGTTHIIKIWYSDKQNRLSEVQSIQYKY